MGPVFDGYIMGCCEFLINTMGCPALNYLPMFTNEMTEVYCHLGSATRQFGCCTKLRGITSQRAVKLTVTKVIPSNTDK